MEEKIVIPVSKAKVLLLLISCLAFVILCIWVLRVIEISRFERIIALIGILFFGWGLFVFSRKLLEKEPGIVIDRYGVTVNIVHPRVGTIEWDDISHTEIMCINSAKLLLIYVHDPEKYLDRVKDFNNIGLRNNYAMVGTPFAISTSILKIKIEVLEELINNSSFASTDL